MPLTDKQKVKIIEEEKYRASLTGDSPSSHKSKKGGFGCGTIALFVIVLLVILSVAILTWQNPSELVKKSEQRKGEIKKDTFQINQQIKNDFVSFYKDFMTIGNQSDKIHKIVTDDLDALSNGGVSVADMYLQAKKAEEIQGGLTTKLSILKIPEDLKPYKDELEKARQNMSTAIYSRKTAMKSMAEFLNTGNLEKMAKIKQDLQRQQSFMLEAVGNLISVATKLDVDISKIKVE